MRIEELIRRLREQLNARTISYNEYTEQLNTLRSAAEPDATASAPADDYTQLVQLS